MLTVKFCDPSTNKVDELLNSLEDGDDGALWVSSIRELLHDPDYAHYDYWLDCDGRRVTTTLEDLEERLAVIAEWRG